MRRWQVLIATVGITCATCVSLGHAASTSPGKTTVFVSATSLPLPAASVALLSGQIVKGKKKRVLTVQAMITTGASAPLALPIVFSLQPLVNGVAMEPTTSNAQGAVVDCGFNTPPTAACTLSGHWWLDLDTAELAHPGTFIGKLLEITLTGGTLAGGIGTPVDVMLSARLETK